MSDVGPASMNGPGAASVASEPVIEVVDVVKVYRDGNIRALDGVSLTVARSEFVSITGPSGCGKSTLLNLLAALDQPTSGVVKVNGRNLRQVKDLSRYRREEVGLVFQLHNLLPQLSALANIEIAMPHSRGRSQSRAERARDLLAEMGLATAERRVPAQLSGGERQRVAIARALANDPGILLADEPTGSLDSASVDNFLQLLRRLRAEHGTTIVMVTHDNEVAAAADRTIEMSDGRVVMAHVS
ncbi:MAG: ABC transporter ATP-binding protein [Acidimicrobiales bacterium]